MYRPLSSECENLANICLAFYMALLATRLPRLCASRPRFELHFYVLPPLHSVVHINVKKNQTLQSLTEFIEKTIYFDNIKYI